MIFFIILAILFFSSFQTPIPFLIYIFPNAAQNWQIYHRYLHLQAFITLITLVSLCWIFTATNRSKLLSLIAYVLFYISIITFFVSLYSTMIFSIPPDLKLIIKLASEYQELKKFVLSQASVALFIILVFDLIILKFLSKATTIVIPVTSIILGCFSIALLINRELLWSTGNNITEKAPSESTSVLDLQKMSLQNIPRKFIPTKRYDRIIVVVVESLSNYHLSYINPQKSSYIPKIESIVKENGVYLANAIASANYSDASVFSLTTGCPAVDLSNLEFSPFKRENLPHINISESYQKAGFTTSLIAAHRLELEGMDNFATKVGFNVAIGRDQSELLRNFPIRPVLDSPPDEVLYKQAEQTLKTIHNKSDVRSLTILMTTSSHVPYSSATTGYEASEKEVWEYVDNELAKFITHQLDEPKTLIVVLGDHHSFNPIEEWESTQFGKSAPYRIGAFFIAKDLKPTTIEQPIVEYDLLRDIDSILDGKTPPIHSFLLHDQTGRGTNPWFTNFFFCLEHPEERFSSMFPFKVIADGDLSFMPPNINSNSNEIIIRPFDRECLDIK